MKNLYPVDQLSERAHIRPQPKNPQGKFCLYFGLIFHLTFSLSTMSYNVLYPMMNAEIHFVRRETFMASKAHLDNRNATILQGEVPTPEIDHAVFAEIGSRANFNDQTLEDDISNLIGPFAPERAQLAPDHPRIMQRNLNITRVRDITNDYRSRKQRFVSGANVYPLADFYDTQGNVRPAYIGAHLPTRTLPLYTPDCWVAAICSLDDSYFGMGWVPATNARITIDTEVKRADADDLVFCLFVRTFRGLVVLHPALANVVETNRRYHFMGCSHGTVHWHNYNLAHVMSPPTNSKWRMTTNERRMPYSLWFLNFPQGYDTFDPPVYLLLLKRYIDEHWSERRENIRVMCNIIERMLELRSNKSNDRDKLVAIQARERLNHPDLVRLVKCLDKDLVNVPNGDREKRTHAYKLIVTQLRIELDEPNQSPDDEFPLLIYK